MKSVKSVIMSLTCRFGDEEEWEEVKCTYDQSTDRLLCREPLRRRGTGRSQLVGATMEVALDDGGSKKVTPMVHVVNSAEEIEMTEISREEASEATYVYISNVCSFSLSNYCNTQFLASSC